MNDRGGQSQPTEAIDFESAFFNSGHITALR